MAGLDLELSEQQTLLRDAIARLTADIETPDWADLTDQLGLGGLTVPESGGGFGGGAIEVALVMAELGPALAGADWLGHAAACAVLGEGPDLVTGQRRASLVSKSTAACLPGLRDSNRMDGTARLGAGAAAGSPYHP